MTLPNYKDGSIVNLMSSIGKAFGIKSKYKPLKILKPEELSGFDNIVLFVVDGMGYDYLAENGKGSIMSRFLRGKITSVFPSETTSALTVFSLGVPAQQHALTGWFMYLKEIGTVFRALPFSPRSGAAEPTAELNPKQLYDQQPIFNKIQAQSYVFYPEKIAHSATTKACMGKARRFGYRSLNGCFSRVRKIIASSNKKKIICIYTPYLDTFCHIYGTKSRKAKQYFNAVEYQAKMFYPFAAKTNTALIITADHGQIDTPRSRALLLDDHPKLKETLAQPLCGWRRAPQCYVKPAMKKQFESYVKSKLSKHCTLYASRELVRKKYFGLFKPNKKLFDRIGDYILIMKKNYELVDFLPKEHGKHFNKGDHGGISDKEMYVPLIVMHKRKA